MADENELRRALALAKSGLRAPPSARARVRARLAGGGAGAAPPPAAPGPASPGAAAPSRSAAASQLGGWARPIGWAVVCGSVGLAAGYWLGFERARASLGALRENAQLNAARALARTEALPVHEAAFADRVEAPAGLSSARPGHLEAQTARVPLPEEVTRPGSSSGHAGEVAGADLERRSRVASTSAVESGRARLRPERSPRAVRRSRAASLPSALPPSAGGDPFAAEVALLQRAERAIRAGEGALALAFLEELERDHPDSSLRVERDVARALARCLVARTGSPAERDAARLAALDLLSQGPSMYAGRARELCGPGPRSSPAAIEEAARRGH